jgi:hypothetical protein
MSFRVAVSDPRRLRELVEALASGDCNVRTLSDRMLEVTDVGIGVAPSPVELSFFLRAWVHAHPGVDLLLV